jgi:hypothetical protein
MSANTILLNRRHDQMVDDVMTAYVKWREACLRVRETYDTWHTASRAEVDEAFPAYNAALDAEQRASETYAGLITQLDRVDLTRHRAEGTKKGVG